MSKQQDLVIDLIPKISEEEREAALRLVNRYPDAAFLRRVLGLDPVLDVAPKPPVTRRPPEPNPLWCSIHQVPRTPRLDRPSQYRCLPCGREYSRRLRERKRAEEALEAINATRACADCGYTPGLLDPAWCDACDGPIPDPRDGVFLPDLVDE